MCLNQHIQSTQCYIIKVVVLHLLHPATPMLIDDICVGRDPQSAMGVPRLRIVFLRWFQRDFNYTFMT